jgi:hypothetical protein
MPRSPTSSRQAKTIYKFTKKVGKKRSAILIFAFGDLNLRFLSFLMPSYLVTATAKNMGHKNLKLLTFISK